MTAHLNIAPKPTPRHPAVARNAHYLLAYKHLPAEAHSVARLCAELTQCVLAEVPDGLELAAGLRKILEARDCLVRAVQDATPPTLYGEHVADTSPAVNGREVIAAGPVLLDVESRQVAINGESVDLPFKEYELLELLLRNAEVALSRDLIVRRVWGTDYFGDTKTLDAHVKRLRSKIEPVPSMPRHIITLRGYGYKFTARQG